MKRDRVLIRELGGFLSLTRVSYTRVRRVSRVSWVSRVSRVIPELGLSLVDGFGVTRGTVVWYRVIRHSWANLLEQISISKISSRSLLCEIVSIELLGSNLCQLGDSGVQDGAYLVIAELHILLP